MKMVSASHQPLFSPYKDDFCRGENTFSLFAFLWLSSYIIGISPKIKADEKEGGKFKMADGMKGLLDGVCGWFGCNGWLMFLIFVLLVIGCGGLGGGGTCGGFI
jgi:hypothetical protein